MLKHQNECYEFLDYLHTPDSTQYRSYYIRVLNNNEYNLMEKITK